jgi:hypothetical protein
LNLVSPLPINSLGSFRVVHPIPLIVCLLKIETSCCQSKRHLDFSESEFCSNTSPRSPLEWSPGVLGWAKLIAGVRKETLGQTFFGSAPEEGVVMDAVVDSPD